MNAIKNKDEKLTDDVLREWQKIIDETAEIFEVPAGLITRLDGDEIEILLSSHTEGNPYPANAKAPYPDSGWFCEYTLKNRDLNLISDARQDPLWRNNDAAVELNIYSYMGMPIEKPNGDLFGTVCFLDNKQNAHNEVHIRLLSMVKRMIELTLKIINDKAELDQRDRYIEHLSKIYPICSYCKRVQEESGDWVEVEKYVSDISGATPSHGICPECYKREMEDIHRK